MEQDIKSLIFKILKVILVVFLLVILLFNTYIMIQSKVKPDKVPSVFGYKPFVVLTGSMETEINIGDLVFVKEIDTNKLKVNDIIAFRNDEDTVTTHRIIDTVNKSGDICFKTKGDSNNVADNKIICSKDIEGKYVYKIPGLGNVIMFIQKPFGFMMMMLLLIIICIFIYFSNNKKVIIDEEELKEFEDYKKEKEKKLKKRQKRKTK